jgi:hypothetical protein
MTDDATLTKLDELLTAINAFDDPRRASAEWKHVFKTLEKADLLTPQAKHIIGMRDVENLTAMIEQLRSPEPITEGEPIDEAELKRAFKAFRKRLTVTSLDDESKLGRSPLTQGTRNSAPTVTPPIEWPNEVWMQLVRQGKLRYIGHGLYGLPITDDHDH